MSVHAIVIATSREDAEAYVAVTPWLEPGDTEWLSSRSPDRVRGIAADVVLATPAACALPTSVIERLRAVALPCIATRGAR